MSVVLQVGNMEVQLRRSARRRTLALQVRRGVATAYAPEQMPQERIVAFLHEKNVWLSRHLAQQARVPALAPTRLGGEWMHLGQRLHLRPGDTVRREGQTLFLPEADWQGHLRHWAMQEAQAPYEALVGEYAATLGASKRLGTVRVTDTRSRWGSCTARGDIRLHWALSRAPLVVLRYVALHEAAHLLELNHSARYWAQVDRIMPDHAQHRAWLREHGRDLLTV